MKRHDALFIAVLAFAVFLLAMTSAQNISTPAEGPGHAIAQGTKTSKPNPPRTGLPLHEARYWKAYE